MKIIAGKKIADKILADFKKEIKIKGIKPCLAVILVGDDPASHLYVRMKEQTAQRVGIKIKKYILSSRISENKILEIIESLNKDAGINGILVQMPLPKKISPDRIIKTIDSKKDVDGFSPKSKFNPPFISAIWEALKTTGEDLKNKKAVALVNSDIFGRTLCGFLRKKGLVCSCVIAKGKAEKADILITALGKPNFIKGSMVKKDVVLIDGGITKRGKKIIGDIDSESVRKKAKWLSQAPGGLGPITIALLLKNVVLATRNL